MAFWKQTHSGSDREHVSECENTLHKNNLLREIYSKGEVTGKGK